MDNHATRLIQDCYEQHDGDGSFVKDDRAIPFKLIRPPISPGGSVLVARKTQLILEAFGYELEPECPGFLGRGSLPSLQDDSWIRAFVDGHRIFFLGDLGPADLMYFAWFRQRSYNAQLEYLGIRDSYLEVLSVSDLSEIAYAMSDSQQEAMLQLNSACPDWCNLVGPNCAGILKSGNAIDLEGIVRLSGSISSLVDQAFFE